MKHAHSLENLPTIASAKIAIIQSKWHRHLTDVMVRKCCEVLLAKNAQEPERHIVPGCLELPLAAKILATKQPKLEAIIAFGIIVKGDTDHYEMVRDESSRGLSSVSLEFNMPVINEIIPVTDLKFAIARAADDEFNKGIEAAIAAIEFIAWRRQQLQ